ncbi:MAG: zinc-binding dehydrogenase [Dehalococcoidia bacterium]
MTSEAGTLPTETTAAVLERLREPLRLRALTLPPLRAGQVLVEVAWSGVCRSQLLEADGGRGEDRYLPHCLGHEGSGVVLAAGPEVTKVRPGDRVVLTWIQGSGANVPGTVYESADGPVNSGAVITFARHAVISENRVVPIAADVPLREAALLGCAVPTGAGAVLNTGVEVAGKTVAVFGAGGVGLSAILGAAMGGAAAIVAVDVRAETLALARTLGATHLVDATGEEPVAAVRALTGGAGADVVVEAAGRVETMEGAYAATRYGGGLCVIAGNPPGEATIAIAPMDLIRGRRITGTWGGETDPDRDVPRYVQAYREGRLPLEQMVGGEFALDEVNAALDALRSGTAGRMLLRMGPA